MSKMLYVYAYKVGAQPINCCIVDVLPHGSNLYGQYKECTNNISVEIFSEKGRMFNRYPLISKTEFESFYGKIEYP